MAGNLGSLFVALAFPYLQAWTRIPEVEIVACCNRTQQKAQKVAKK